MFRFSAGRVGAGENRQGGVCEAAAIVWSDVLPISVRYKVERSQVRDGGFQRGRLSARERRTQRPFGRLLLVLFLPEQEKYIRSCRTKYPVRPVLADIFCVRVRFIT